MKGIVLSLWALLALSLSANAQYKFTISGGFSGDCNGVQGVAQVQQMLQILQGQVVSGFPDKATCEQVRAQVNNVKAQAQMITYNSSGKVVGSKNYNCSFSLSTSPCVGSNSGYSMVFGMSDGTLTTSVGNPNVMGPDMGTSFFSHNLAEEISNWSADDARKRLLLNPDEQLEDPEQIFTGDDLFDEARTDYTFLDSLPEGSFRYAIFNKDVTVDAPPSSDTPVYLDELNMVMDPNKMKMGYKAETPDVEDLTNIEVKPVPIPEMTDDFDEEKFQLMKSGVSLAKDVGMYLWEATGAVAGETVAVAGLLADANINLWGELYRAIEKANKGESYDAPSNLITDCAVKLGGQDFAITGNILYNAGKATLDDITSFVLDKAGGAATSGTMKFLGSSKASVEAVSNAQDVLSIASDSFKLGGDITDYNSK